ncbi:MAG: hypothetical protein ACM3ZT_07565 [Bacillota bacterium]
MSKLGFSLALALSVMASAAWAAEAPFVGTWKLDPSKTTLADVMKVESAGGNKYTFDVGGGPETVTADGTDQPGYAGTTVAVTLTGPDSLKFVRKQAGRVLLTAYWKLSQDGSTLNDDFTSFAPDGSPSNVKMVFARTAGTSGLMGTWESTSAAVNFQLTITIQPYDGSGLSLIPTSDKPKNLTFDGKDYPNLSSNAPAGSTYSARRVSARSFEMTDKVDGKVMDTREYVLSPDHKTLTVTIHKTGVRSPNILVFERL